MSHHEKLKRMIDDKKIDIAAKTEVLSKHANEAAYFQLRSIGDFKEGANWAIHEFLKDLWHPANKKPLLRNGKCLVVYNSGKVDIFSISFVYEMLSNYGKDGMDWKYWAYVSDLFPKEAVEQDGCIFKEVKE